MPIRAPPTGQNMEGLGRWEYTFSAAPTASTDNQECTFCRRTPRVQGPPTLT